MRVSETVVTRLMAEFSNKGEKWSNVVVHYYPAFYNINKYKILGRQEGP